MHQLFKTIACLTALIYGSAGWAAIAWDESVDGELSSDPQAPTAVTFVTGGNSITGSMGGTEEARDFITFALAPGQSLTALTLVSYEGNDIVGFHAINEGATSFIPGGDTASEFLGGNHLYGFDVGNDLLPQLAQSPLAGSGFETPLGPGTYSYVIQQTGFDTTRYSVEFSVVPVPAAAWLFGSALALLGWIRRRF